MGLSKVGWDEIFVSYGGDGVCGSDGCCSVMMVVEVVVYISGSSMILITVLTSRVVSLLQGTIEDIGCGFNIFIGEIHVWCFLIEGSPMKAVARM